MISRAISIFGLVLVLAGCGDHSGSTGPYGSTAAPVSTATTTPPTTTPPTTTPPTTTPPATGPTYIVSGWLPRWALATGDTTLDANVGNGLDEVNLFGWGLQPDGTLIKASGIDDPGRIAAIRTRGGEIIPTVYDVHNSGSIAAVLADPAVRATAIQSMVDLVVSGGYDGLDIDFEHSKSAIRDAFSSFVEDLGQAIRNEGKVFSVTVPPKRQPTPSWTGYDYARLGAAADRVKIMCYGYSGTWGNAGPIGPVDWMVRVLDYAVTQFPAGKIQVAIPFYGYDWPNDGSRIRSVTYLRSGTLTPLANGGVTFDTTRGEATFTYTDNGVDHEVWFNDERSVAAKAALVKQYGCRGLSIWALGYGDTPLWDAIRQELKQTP